MFGGPPKYFPTQSGGGALIFLISQGGGGKAINLQGYVRAPDCTP